ncbi:YqhG family protein [Priestia taiwanensis]|uniref:Uncharacterized protein n=1 Tax=Priestia taiwanensis TaxID=1347902 RepID=A0A917ES76_9BACI|nr:YqhG family protein [Priestia taiwanensis]MBM7363818.1 hypothetical protein [Priestia taiwanensis]GGE73881.1 hypothetical protein GCM10007140_24680 [Priestia taiwanensis]
MQQHDIHHYLNRFFTTTECDVTSNPHGLDVQLTMDMDKKLMNRPFYWHYLEKTGGTPNPMKLSFITNPNDVPDDIQGETIHYGSTRLHQIFTVVQELGGHIRLFEEARNITNNTPLHPWILLNMKVSYQCDRKKDILYSFGIHLLSGRIIKSFYDTLHTLSFSPKIPDFCFTLSPFIKPQSGIKRIEDLLTSMLESEEHIWADEARNRWEHDLQLLEKFYEGLEELPESYHIEKSALKEQYEPKIHISVINGGLFYLTEPSTQVCLMKEA